MKKVNCTSNFLCLIPCAKAALKTVQCAALIAPYVFRQFDGGGGVERHASSAGNKRGDLRPEFFIMPPFKTAGLMSGGTIWSALAPLGRATTRLRNGYAYSGTAARG